MRDMLERRDGILTDRLEEWDNAMANHHKSVISKTSSI